MARLISAIKSNKTSNYNSKCIREANKNDNINWTIICFFAGKNFTVTKMRSIKNNNYFLWDYMSLSSPQYTVLRDNSMFLSPFSLSGIDFIFVFSPNLVPAKKKREMKEYMTKKKKKKSFPFQRTTESCWTPWMKKES